MLDRLVPSCAFIAFACSGPGFQRSSPPDSEASSTSAQTASTQTPATTSSTVTTVGESSNLTTSDTENITSASTAPTNSDASSSGDATTDSTGCPNTLEGWAQQNGDAVEATTGGGALTPVRPTTAAQLVEYSADPQPRVIEIEGQFSVPRLVVSSNKTLIGVGKHAILNGALQIRGTSARPVSNVIVRNLNINGAQSDLEDALQVTFAHHVWVDHCDIWDGPDGNLDITHASNWITVSWTKFRYTDNYRAVEGESGDHRFSSLVGHDDDNAREDDARLKVTFHHNWWAEGVIERMPRVRFGQVHVYNNYFNSEASNYCVRAGRNAHLLLENNYFDQVDSPHEFNNQSDQQTAHITAVGNTYNQTRGERATGGGGAPFEAVPYNFSLDDADDVPSLVQKCIGPREADE